jgi:CRP-like cAMP-binding protein
MKDAFYKFNKSIGSVALSDPDIEILSKYCKLVHFKKGDIIIEEGVKQDYIYFIIKGIVRNYHITEDRSIKTFSFRAENMIATGYALQNHNEHYKALMNVECMENCEMVIISFTGLKYLEETSKSAQIIARYLLEEHLIELVKHRINFVTKSLMDRYYELELQFPNIHKRIPQNIIASFLGVSSVHLSRVKNMK